MNNASSIKPKSRRENIPLMRELLSKARQGESHMFT